MTGMRMMFRQSETISRMLGRLDAEFGSLMSDILSDVAVGSGVECEDARRTVLAGPQIQRRQDGERNAKGERYSKDGGRLPQWRARPDDLGPGVDQFAQRPALLGAIEVGKQP